MSRPPVIFLVACILLTPAIIELSGPERTSARAGTISTFGDGSSQALLTFPPGGGSNSSLNLTLPGGCKVKSASMMLEGVGIPSANATMNYTFTPSNGTSRTVLEGNTTNVTLAPGGLQGTVVPLADYELIRKDDTKKKYTNTSVQGNFAFQLYSLNVTTQPSSIRVGWTGCGWYNGGMLKYHRAWLKIRDVTNSSWFTLGTQFTIFTPQNFTFIGTVSGNATNFVDPNGTIHVLVHGPKANSAFTSLETNHIFIEVIGQGMQFPTGLSVDVGADADVEWRHTGPLVGKREFNGSHGFTATLTNLVNAAPTGAPWLDVPILINCSTEGKLKVSGLVIDYDPAPPPPASPELVRDIPNGTYSFPEDSGKGAGLVNLSTYFSDADTQNLTFEITLNDDALVASLDGPGPLLDFTAPPDWFGEGTYRVKATDEGGRSATSNPFVVTVTPTNDAPEIIWFEGVDTSGDGALVWKDPVIEDEWTNLTLVVRDIDGDAPAVEPDPDWEAPAALTASASEGLAPGDPQAHVYSLDFMPTQAQVGVHVISIWASDGNGTAPMSDVLNVTFEVENSQDAPAAGNVPDQSVKQDMTLSVTLTATDEDDPSGAGLTWSTNLTDGKGDDDLKVASLDPLTGQFTFTPGNAHVGTHHVEAKVSDGIDDDRVVFAITVINVNDPPMAAVASPSGKTTVHQGTVVSLDGTTSTDPDLIHASAGEKLGFSWSSNVTGPLGTGEVLMHNFTDAGLHLVTLRVTDREGLYSEATVTVTVTGTGMPSEPGGDGEGEEPDDGDDGDGEEPGGNVTDGDSPGGDGGPEDPVPGGDGGDDGKEGESGGAGLTMLALAAAIVLALVLILVMLVRRRKASRGDSGDATEDNDPVGPVGPVGQLGPAPVPKPSPPSDPVSPEAPVPSIQGGAGESPEGHGAGSDGP